MIELKDIITILSILLANGIALATAFTRLNIRIAEIAQDQNSLRAKIDEHTYHNRVDLKEIKEAAGKDRDTSRIDYMNVMKEIASLNKNVSDLRVDIVKAMKNVK